MAFRDMLRSRERHGEDLARMSALYSIEGAWKFYKQLFPVGLR